jgi:hypothetical protein
MLNLDITDIAFKLVGIIILVLVLLFILTWAGFVKCSQIPFWCDVYETALGSPRVLIVHGNEGLGNPEELRELLLDPRRVGVNSVDLMNIERLSLGNLTRYKLVIVEKAKKMSIEQLSMFIDYVNIYGGRLVWVGDAGTEGSNDELEDLVDVEKLKSILDNPWARAKEKETEYEVVNFDEFLGLRFVGNYCEEFNCASKNFSAGIINPEITNSHPLIYGSHPALELRIDPKRDFSLVSQFPNISNSSIVLSLDMGSAKEGLENSFPRYVPIISVSGVGEKVAYYAYPLEYFCEDNNYPNACTLYLKNMYRGMLGK